MDDRHPTLENSSPLEPFIDRLAKELVHERIDNGHIDVRNMSFAEMEMLGHQIDRPAVVELELGPDCAPMSTVKRVQFGRLSPSRRLF